MILTTFARCVNALFTLFLKYCNIIPFSTKIRANQKRFSAKFIV